MEAGLGDEMGIVTVAKRCQRESKWSMVLLASVQKMGFCERIIIYIYQLESLEDLLV